MKKKLLAFLLLLLLPLNVWAAEVKLTGLPEVTSLTPATDIVPVVASGTTSKITVANFLKSPVFTTSILPIAPGVTSIGSTDAEWGNVYLGDSASIYFGASQDVVLTHMPGSGLMVGGDKQLRFRDSGLYLHSDADGYLDITADTGIRLHGTVLLDDSAVFAGQADGGNTLISSATGWSATLPFTFNSSLRLYDGDSHYLTVSSADLTGDSTLVLGGDTNTISLTNGTAGFSVGPGKTFNVTGTLTDGKYCTYSASGNVIACNSDGGVGGGVSTDTLWAAAGDLVYGTGNDTADILGIGTAGQILQVNLGATAPQWTSAIAAQFDDSAAQFKSATASKGTLKFDQTGISDTKLVTVKYTATDNVTFNPTVSSTSYGLGSLNFATTGTISGKIPMITKSDDYVLGTDSAQEAYGYMVWMSGNKTLTLPAVAAGMNVCVYSTDATAKMVDPNASDGIRNGTDIRNADGHKITSAGDTGNFVCLVADSADGWTVLGKSGVWTDE